MNTALARLNAMKPGYATIMWDRVVIRIGDRYAVGTENAPANIRKAELTAEQAAAILTQPK